MIEYIIKSTVFLLTLITFYKLFLENEKMHLFNRIYLNGSILFSLTVPLGHFSFKTKIASKLISLQLNEIIIQKTDKNLNVIYENEIMSYIIISIYMIIMTLLLFRFFINIKYYYKKIKNNEHKIFNGSKLILLNEPIIPHSFLNYIFLNKQDYINNKIPSELLVHEDAHLKQKHTLDILFIEIVNVLFWFNPILILYKRAIKLNHEFLADEVVNKQFNSVSYYQEILLQIASNQSKIALASPINYLITKKRLIMMTKNESKAKIILKTASVGFIYSILFFALNTKIVAQEQSNEENLVKVNKSLIISKNTEPLFPGGMEAFYTFVGKNFKISKEANKMKLKGKIYLTFMIEKDGSLSEFKILRDIGYGTGKEAVRVLKLSPKWIPGTVNNKPAKVQYNLPITIQTD
jgi:beta-lactamase regulating signal transducer with metallopeptidase domain